MHVYNIPEGTSGYLFTLADLSIRKWTTRKDLSFIETVIDPIKAQNGRLTDIDKINVAAIEGYAVFGGEYGCENGQPYYLFIPYNDIEVL